ncbi:MAG: MarR family winged helix-turn-helix transcriptional regulator [Desulfurococcales archaeon]|nr:MarR family winged helix-turn-helix transcriptional regulator [Desulfurococcales archaeon]
MRVKEPPDDARILFSHKRFIIATVLYLAGPMTMARLREATGLSWGDLDSNIRYLERHGLVEVRRILTLRGPRVMVDLTGEGRRAYRLLARYLREVVGSLDAEPGEGDAGS